MMSMEVWKKYSIQTMKEREYERVKRREKKKKRERKRERKYEIRPFSCRELSIMAV